MGNDAKITISLINRVTGQVTRFEDLRLRSELAVRLVEQIETLLADLAPGRASITRHVAAGSATIIDIDLRPLEKLSHRPPEDRAQPPHLTFEQRYRRQPQERRPDDAT
jgi:hypothetical protein